MGQPMTILCGSCHVAVEKGVDPNSQMMAVCPCCGQSDTLENAAREAPEYFTDKAVRESFAMLDNPGITVTHSPERNYRFIMTDQIA